MPTGIAAGGQTLKTDVVLGVNMMILFSKDVSMKELGHLVSETGCSLNIGLVYEVVAGH